MMMSLKERFEIRTKEAGGSAAFFVKIKE
jgi:hypothetical protein